MKRLFLSLLTVFIVFSLPVQEVEAKRFGGGKTSGLHRDTTTPQGPAVAPRNADAPAPQGAASAPANAAGKRSWLGPVAGLAAGLGLAALASHLGLSEELASILLIALLAMGALLLFKFLGRNRANARAGMRYAGAGGPGGTAPFRDAMTPPSAAAAPLTTNFRPHGEPRLPEGFDTTAFLRQAKLNFLRLQAANDAGNLDDIYGFTSPEMYAEIKLQLEERGSTTQRTDVLDLHAEILDYVEEARQHRVSVRFHGQIREEQGAQAADFSEIWHLTKPTDGRHGWVAAGVQQAD